ncbi:MAG TPA: M23 family metallopeptidase [bacterium]|nr:M23 family metallopeptidase [bacterium]HQG45975.1 M23 family metallopeptidase [bacterium]HQI49247.1 M23 family metallopeptidase [bacterium]HQJ63571.1 M23 family metallopeptidase [bacterium]
MKLPLLKKPASNVRRHRRLIQILVIPDDQAEPRHYTLSVRKLKVMRAAGIVLALHFLFGVVAYFQWARFAVANSGLHRVNEQLVENSRKVYELAALFQKLEASDAKLRSALGLGENHESQSLDSEALGSRPLRGLPPEPPRESQLKRVEPVEVNISEKLGFLQQSKEIGIHEYLKSLPTYLPVAGVLTRNYSEEGTAHYGIDIAAPRGTFISSAGDGVVIFSGWTQDLGNMVIVYHGNGFFTYYGHTQRNLVLRSTLVRKGDHIALVGSSGESTAPHLHFELWKDGVALNPADYILAFARM